MYSRYISSLTRFSSILDPTGFPGNFSILAISSCVFISRVSRFFSSLYSIHAAVFSYSFIFLWMIPLFPLTVLFYSPFFFFSFFLFFFLFLLPSHPVSSGLFALHSPLPHSYAGHIISPRKLLFRTPLASLLFAIPFLHRTTVISRAIIHREHKHRRLLPKLNEELRDLVIFLRSSSFVRIRRAPHFTSSILFSFSPSFLRETVNHYIHSHYIPLQNSREKLSLL